LSLLLNGDSYISLMRSLLCLLPRADWSVVWTYEFDC